MRRLEGKVAIVTGGAGGIGSATAHRLTSEGARVAVADIDLPRAREVARAVGSDAIAVQYDAADAASIQSLVETTIKHYGRLDILHNNAAITAPEKQSQDTTAVDIPFEIWELTLRVNLTSYLAASKYALPHMIAQGSGASFIYRENNSRYIGVQYSIEGRDLQRAVEEGQWLPGRAAGW